jgi:hypothetical protein
MRFLGAPHPPFGRAKINALLQERGPWRCCQTNANLSPLDAVGGGAAFLFLNLGIAGLWVMAASPAGRDGPSFLEACVEADADVSERVGAKILDITARVQRLGGSG